MTRRIAALRAGKLSLVIRRPALIFHEQTQPTACRRGVFILISVLSLCREDMGGALTQVACIGNSITMGAGLEQGESYPGKLQNLLGSEYSVHNGGKGGACVVRTAERNYLGSEEMRQVMALEPDIVTVMLGSNDSQPLNRAHRDDFVDDYRALVDTLRALRSKPCIWLCLPPPAFSHEHDIDNDTIVQKIIPMIRQIADEDTLLLVDTHTPFENRRDLYGSDGIHLTGEGTTLMAQVLYDALTEKTVMRGGSRNRARADFSRGPFARSFLIVNVNRDTRRSHGLSGISLTGRIIAPHVSTARSVAVVKSPRIP